MRNVRTVLVAVVAGLMLSVTATAEAGVATSAARETAEYVLQKFGRGTAGQTVEEVTDSDRAGDRASRGRSGAAGPPRGAPGLRCA